MILKRMTVDDKNRIVTHWAPDVESATRLYDEEWQCEAVELHFRDGHPKERVLLHDGEGVYLCNDEGRTVEVLSRLRDPART